MRVRTDHHHIGVPRQHSGCVRWCFPPAQLGISLAQYDYVAAQLHHAYFERNAGPGGWFLKYEDNGFTFQGPLKGKTIVLIFEKPSTRTRVSFEVGMMQLGGNVVVLSERDSQLGRGETPADTARVLSRYADMMMIRTDSHQKLLDLAKFATVPVINGRL